MATKKTPNVHPSPQRPSIVYSPSSPAPLSMTFGDLLKTHAEKDGNRPAVISQSQNVELTYAQLHDRSTNLAKGLVKLGVQKGDLVAITLGNRVEYFEVFFACAKIGAALVLFNYAFSESEMLDLMRSIGPKVLFTVPGFTRYDYTKLLPKLATEVSQLQTIVLLEDIGKKYHFSKKGYPNFVSYNTLLQQSASSELPAVQISPHDLVNVQFTSGSTGLPKSPALSHYNIMNCGWYASLNMGMTDKDRVCLPVPMFHSFGMCIGLSTSIVAGSCIVLPSELFDAGQTLQSIQRYRCTGIYGVTTMFITELAHKSFAATDRSSLQFGIMTGAATPDELIQRIMSSFPIRRLYTGWGMTELSSIVTMTHAHDPLQKKLQTAGRLFPHNVGKVVKPNTGQVVPWGEKGELVICGYGNMHSYLGNKVKTDESLRYHEEDLQPGGVGGVGNGGQQLRRWMHTGDEGYLDEGGYFVISGRIKDIIIRGGENISPLEIEERLFAHPAIAQAAIIGVPDAKYGEEVAAFVELREGERRPGDEELRVWIRETLSYFKAPRYFWWIGGEDGCVLEEWPKTASGKVCKPDLRVVGNELMSKTRPRL